MMNWFSKKKSHETFSGNYLCKCVENYYKSRILNEPSFQMTDHHTYNLFMSVPHPVHQDIDGKRVCKVDDHESMATREGYSMMFYCCNRHREEAHPNIPVFNGPLNMFHESNLN